jgi:hypothetical protein
MANAYGLQGDGGMQNLVKHISLVQRAEHEFRRISMNDDHAWNLSRRRGRGRGRRHWSQRGSGADADGGSGSCTGADAGAGVSANMTIT